MPRIGDKVRISGTDSFWDGKEGIVKDVFDDGSCTVALDFGNGRETLQDFDGEYAESMQEDGKMSKKIDERKKLGESASTNERAKALADCLHIGEDEVVQSTYDDKVYETPEGDYLVLTKDEARKRAEDDIQGIIDDMGIEAFAPDFRYYILLNLVDEDSVRKDMLENNMGYANDIEDESSMDYENRLIEEMHGAGILTDDDFEKDEAGEPDYFSLRHEVDLNEKKEEFAEYLTDQKDVYDFLDEMGSESAYAYLTKNNRINWEEVKEQCIRIDGIAHFIADYDGNEIELGDGWYAYRIN